MPGSRNPPHSTKERAARAVQLENDTAALHLVRQAAGIEVRAAKLAAVGNVAAAAVLARATTYRAVAARLVLARRPASLGVPQWLQAAGITVTVTPSPIPHITQKAAE